MCIRDREEAVSKRLMMAERISSEEAVEEEKEEYAPKAGSVLKKNGVLKTSAEDLSERVRRIVEDLGGMVLSLDYNGEHDFPSYVTVQIPVVQYGKFLEKIKALGNPKGPTPDLPDGAKDQITVRIELLEPTRGFQ